ncbi:MAG: rod shape-determining protein MreC, partial [bacterium]
VRTHLDDARLKHLEEENLRLRAMLDLKKESFLHLIPADVVGQTSDAKVVGLIVARGFLHGVRPSAAVLNEKGLVGRVWRVSEASAIVQTIADPQLGIPSQLSTNGAQGITRWKGLGRMRLEGIPSTVKVSFGDSVVTSSAGGIFPPQILIGKVVEVKPAEERWLWDIEVSPSVNVPFIGEVFIVGPATE